MSQVQVFNRTFLRGLQTTVEDGGAPDFSGFRRFLNTRVDTGEAARRPGMARVHRFASIGTAMQFQGAKYATGWRNPAAWDLNRDPWCLEAYANITAPVAGMVLLDSAPLKLYYDGAWKADVGAMSLTGVAGDHVAVYRIGGTLYMAVDGAAADSTPFATVAPTAGDIFIGSDSTPGNFFVGDVDYIRLRSVVPPDWRQRKLRLLNPRGQTVLACYQNGPDANKVIWDESIYEAHAIGTVNSTVRFDERQHLPVQLIQPYVDDEERRRLLIVAEGKEYSVAY